MADDEPADDEPEDDEDDELVIDDEDAIEQGSSG
jgi:hypothetical protein